MNEHSGASANFNLFDSMNFTYGVVIRCNEEKIKKLQSFLIENNISVVFEKITSNNLWIKEGEK